MDRPMTYQTLFHSKAEEGIQNTLLCVLAYPEGINAVEITSLIGLGIDSVKCKLRELYRRKEIERVCVCGNTYLWMSPSCASDYEIIRAEKARCRENEGRERRRIQEAHRREKESEMYSKLPMVQRVIDARSAPRLSPPCPRWVFELAA